MEIALEPSIVFQPRPHSLYNEKTEEFQFNFHATTCPQRLCIFT